MIVPVYYVLITMHSCPSLSYAVPVCSGRNIFVYPVFPLLCRFPHIYSDICESLYWFYGYYSLYLYIDCYSLTDKFTKSSTKVDRTIQEDSTAVDRPDTTVMTRCVVTFPGRCTSGYIERYGVYRSGVSNKKTAEVNYLLCATCGTGNLQHNMWTSLALMW